jgi:GrpB-like predicted nucleotidyltransferase (UPF0157 family)/GNAT superfamily N-acetyltransferase
MRVRRATESDARAIAEVHVRSWLAAYRGILPENVLDGLSASERERSWRRHLGSGGEHWWALVAEVPGAGIAGFCSVATPSRDEGAGERTAEVTALYVDPDRLREGTGGVLLAAALGELSEKGWHDAVLWVLPENEGALAFYNRFEFAVEPGVEKVEERSGRPVIRLRVSLDEPVRLAPYDPAWPSRFDSESAALEAAIRGYAPGGIHHVGSTAVPDLEAKPIIDILVGVRSLEESRACFEPLARLGYVYAPYLPDEMHWLCKPHPSRRTHHLHLVPANSKRYRDELAFRDRLRADRTLAAEYAALKRALARRFEQDREAYTEAKSDFIRRALGDR